MQATTPTEFPAVMDRLGRIYGPWFGFDRASDVATDILCGSVEDYADIRELFPSRRAMLDAMADYLAARPS